MKAVLTLDNGEKFIADIYPLQGKKQHRPRFHDEYERWFVEEFVKADLMPHHIRITNIRVERLQDISEADCLKEGIWCDDNVGLEGTTYWYHGLANSSFRTAKEAYAALIDKISGKGTWEGNPWVFVYDFELIK